MELYCEGSVELRKKNGWWNDIEKEMYNYLGTMVGGIILRRKYIIT